MIIACTHDLEIRASMSLVPASAWGTIVLLNVADQQAAASDQLVGSIGNLKAGEPLCLAAHQVSSDFGDSDGEWIWSATDLAALLQQGLPTGFNAPILIYAVSPAEVATFANDLAAALRTAKAFCGGTVYGFNKPVTVATTPYPSPQQLATNANLTGTTVQC